MDLIDRLHQISSQIEKQKDIIETEEATKTAFIMPFIQALGYNVFDPTEVTPELVADVGIRRGEKIDYAIMKDGQPIILIECKSCNTNLDSAHFSQLYRYFSVTAARFGVLTNGVVYRFFTDLDSRNKMDKKHFLEFNMLDIREGLVEELKKFTKSAFDVDEILSTANELKYTSEIKRIMAQQLKEPEEDFVRFFAAQVYSGPLRANVREQFTEITKQAFRQFIREQIDDRLKSALSSGETTDATEEKSEVTTPEEAKGIEERRIETTEEEYEAFHIIKAILREVVDPTRITMRDVQSYCGILLDDNNRKPIARLHFNRVQKHLGLFDAEKNEATIPIDDLNEIYQYADRLKATPAFYDDELDES